MLALVDFVIPTVGCKVLVVKCVDICVCFLKGGFKICGEVGERIVPLTRQLAGSSRLAARWSGTADCNDGCLSPPAECSL